MQFYNRLKSLVKINGLIAIFLLVVGFICFCIRMVDYQHLSLDLLLELEVLLAWMLKANKVLLVLVMGFCVCNTVILVNNKSIETRTYAIQLIADLVKALVLAFLAYAVMPALLNINTVLIYSNLIMSALIQAGEPASISVHELINSYMDKKEDAASSIKKHEEGEYVAGIRRVNSNTGRLCLALKEVVDATVEASGGNSTWKGWSLEKGYDIAQKVTRIPDTPCVDVPLPGKKK